MRIRDAERTEREALEQLQRRSSGVWVQFREQLAAHADAIELPARFIDHGWVRVAATSNDTAIGFAVVFPRGDGRYELDGLFVEPDSMRRGIGRALVEDACDRARSAGASSLDVTAGPARGFYEKLGFKVTGTVETRFAPAVRMRRDL